MPIWVGLFGLKARYHQLMHRPLLHQHSKTSMRVIQIENHSICPFFRSKSHLFLKQETVHVSVRDRLISQLCCHKKFEMLLFIDCLCGVDCRPLLVGSLFTTPSLVSSCTLASQFAIYPWQKCGEKPLLWWVQSCGVDLTCLFSKAKLYRCWKPHQSCSNWNVRSLYSPSLW